MWFVCDALLTPPPCCPFASSSNDGESGPSRGSNAERACVRTPRSNTNPFLWSDGKRAQLERALRCASGAVTCKWNATALEHFPRRSAASCGLMERWSLETPPFWNANCYVKGFLIPWLWFGNVDCIWTTNTQKTYNLYGFIQWHQVLNSSDRVMDGISIRAWPKRGAGLHLRTMNLMSVQSSSYRRNGRRLIPLHLWNEPTPSGLTLVINAVFLRAYTRRHTRSIKDKHAIYSEGRSVVLNKMSWGGFGRSCASGLGLLWHRSIFKW